MYAKKSTQKKPCPKTCSLREYPRFSLLLALTQTRFAHFFKLAKLKQGFAYSNKSCGSRLRLTGSITLEVTPYVNWLPAANPRKNPLGASRASPVFDTAPHAQGCACVFHRDRDIALENRSVKYAKRSEQTPGVAFFLGTFSWPCKKKYLAAKGESQTEN